MFYYGHKIIDVRQKEIVLLIIMGSQERPKEKFYY